MYIFIVAVFFYASFSQASALWCYQCVSNQPGCGTPFNWLWHWTKVCPEDNDVCVKIIEKKDGQEVITRDCLSYLQGIRTDIPADHYEGCRPAAVDVKLGHYVNNSIKELDIHKNYYDSTMWCFCFLDHRCNGSLIFYPSITVIALSIISIFFIL